MYIKYIKLGGAAYTLQPWDFYNRLGPKPKNLSFQKLIIPYVKMMMLTLLVLEDDDSHAQIIKDVETPKHKIRR